MALRKKDSAAAVADFPAAPVKPEGEETHFQTITAGSYMYPTGDAPPPDPQYWQPPDQGMIGQPPSQQLPASPEQPLGPSPLVGPPALGKTPTAINQIFLPGGYKATHFRGPVSSGGSATGEVPGVSLSSIALFVDYSMGAFSLPVQLPKDSILLWRVLQTYVAFNGTAPSVGLGSASGLNDISAAAVIGALGTVLTGSIATALPQAGSANPFQCFVTVTAGTGNTAGSALVLLVFARLALPWN